MGRMSRSPDSVLTYPSLVAAGALCALSICLGVFVFLWGERIISFGEEADAGLIVFMVVIPAVQVCLLPLVALIAARCYVNGVRTWVLVLIVAAHLCGILIVFGGFFVSWILPAWQVGPR